METLKFLNFDSVHTATLAYIPASRPYNIKDRRVAEQVLQNVLTDADKKGVNVAVPADGVMFDSRYGNAFSHLPEERAAMLYEAITAKNANGKYVYDAIFLPGGSNGEDVLFELDRILKEKGEILPDRTNSLKIFGFSDATQFLRSFGQNGIASPFLYSGGFNTLVSDFLVPDAGLQKAENLLESVYVPERQQSGVTDGFLLPANSRQSLYKANNQPRFSDRLENIMVEELQNENAVNFLIDVLKHPVSAGKRKTVLVSKDSAPGMPQLLAQKLKEEGLTDIGVYAGAPFGHGEQMRDGVPIPMYVRSTLSISENGRVVWKFDDRVDRNEVDALKRMPFIPPIKKIPVLPTTNIIEVVPQNYPVAGIENMERIAPDSGVIVLDLKNSYSAEGGGQRLQMGLSRLLEENRISKEDIKQVVIRNHDTASSDNKKIFSFWADQFQKRYLPHAVFSLEPQMEITLTKDRKEISPSEIDLSRPRVFVFSGAGLTTEKKEDAFHSADHLKDIMREKNISSDGIDFYDTYYSRNAEGDIKELNSGGVDSHSYSRAMAAAIFSPLVQENGRKLEASEAIKRVQKVSLRGHCMGTAVIAEMGNVLTRKMSDLGYGKDDISSITSKVQVLLSGSPVDSKRSQAGFDVYSLVNLTDETANDVKFGERQSQLEQRFGKVPDDAPPAIVLETEKELVFTKLDRLSPEDIATRYTDAAKEFGKSNHDLAKSIRKGHGVNLILNPINLKESSFAKNLREQTVDFFGAALQKFVDQNKKNGKPSLLSEKRGTGKPGLFGKVPKIFSSFRPPKDDRVR